MKSSRESQDTTPSLPSSICKESRSMLWHSSGSGTRDVGEEKRRSLAPACHVLVHQSIFTVCCRVRNWTIIHTLMLIHNLSSFELQRFMFYYTMPKWISNCQLASQYNTTSHRNYRTENIYLKMFIDIRTIWTIKLYWISIQYERSKPI